MRAALIIGGLSLLLAVSCSIVFRSSIQGTVIDREAWDEDNTVTGVANAKVFLYTDEAARKDDVDAYIDGDETTLPDGSKREHLYFQSTVTDADGGYDFTGFIWEKFFSEYGKTADRAEVFLLIYHPDYGLCKNPVPLYVVSDVTNQLPQITIADLWNQGRLAGTVLDWKDDKGLGNVAVNFYVAESWTYATDGSFETIKYPRTATATTTTDDNGAWAATMRFAMKPNKTAHAFYNNAPVRISYVRENYRANDPADGTGLSNTGLVVNVDRDNDGVTAEGKQPDGTTPASFYDYEDAFVVETLSYDDDEGEAILKTVTDVTMQRWRFTAEVRGRVKDDSEPTANYLNNITVKLTIDNSGEVFTAYSEQQLSGETTVDGGFNLGTIVWYIEDATDKETGNVEVTMDTDSYDLILVDNGSADSLLPDTQRNLTLIVDVVP